MKRFNLAMARTIEELFEIEGLKSAKAAAAAKLIPLCNAVLGAASAPLRIFTLNYLKETLIEKREDYDLKGFRNFIKRYADEVAEHYNNYLKNKELVGKSADKDERIKIEKITVDDIRAWFSSEFDEGYSTRYPKRK